jgi:hypothetical protein
MSDVLRFTSTAGEVFYALVLGWNDERTLAYAFWDNMQHTVVKPSQIKTHFSVPHDPLPEISWTPLKQVGQLDVLTAEQAQVKWHCPVIARLQNALDLTAELSSMNIAPYLKANRAHFTEDTA